MKNNHPHNRRRLCWQPLFSGIAAANRRGSYGVYSAEELKELMHYERLRSERSGEPGSVLVCHLNGHGENSRSIRRAVKTLTRTVRETDHIGWLNDSDLAVVLPGTRTEDAEQLKSMLKDSGLGSDSDLQVQTLLLGGS